MLLSWSQTSRQMVSNLATRYNLQNEPFYCPPTVLQIKKDLQQKP